MKKWLIENMTGKPKFLVGIDEAGEPVRGTGARPCLVFSEYLEENTDKVYSSCKEGAKLYDR